MVERGDLLSLGYRDFFFGNFRLGIFDRDRRSLAIDLDSDDSPGVGAPAGVVADATQVGGRAVRLAIFRNRRL